MIDGKTAVCGLIGDPVEHTLSPLIHNTLARQMGQNLVYVPFRVEGGEDEVRRAVEGAYALHLRGLNVTVPHKAHVLPALVQVDPLAAQIGAVNTLVRTEGGYRGYNTDVTGLGRAMESEGIALSDERVLVLGAGGAARAAAFLCASRGARQIFLLNRTIEKAALLAEEVNRAAGRPCASALRLADYETLPEGRFLAIQCTSVGLAPHGEEAVLTDRAFYRKIHTGYDLIYRPASTRFMRLVQEQGGRAFHGLKMLLYQGVDAYELWNGVTVPQQTVRYVYERMKEALGIET